MRTPAATLLCCLLVVRMTGQGFIIKEGTTLSLGSSSLSLRGHLTILGSLNAGTGTVCFNGDTTQTVFSAPGNPLYKVVVEKTGGNVQLTSDIAVNGDIIIDVGDIDLNGQSITLGNAAWVQETGGNTIKGEGSISGTTALDAPNAVHPFGLGVTITSDEDLGSTIITRGHTVQTGGSGISIRRYFDILPSINTTLNATVVFRYHESELNGIAEGDLKPFRSTDGGSEWTPVDGSVDTAANTVTLSGIGILSRWTLGSASAPLPVQMTGLMAEVEEGIVRLQWTTVTEIDNAGWNVERRVIAEGEMRIAEWKTVGFVEGAGTSTSPREYQFIDDLRLASSDWENLHPTHAVIAPRALRFAYRLKQLDRSGSFSYSEEIEVDLSTAPRVFFLSQNYPNPFNPSTTISYTLVENGHVELVVYDAIGRQVSKLVSEEQIAGIRYDVQFTASHLSSGLYFARLRSAGKTLMRTMVLVK